MSRATRFAAISLLLLTAAPSRHAQPTVRLLHAPPTVLELGPKGSMKLLQEFDRRLSKTDDLLLAGEPRKAYREATSLLERMVDTIIAGPATGRLLGLATVLRAIAAYELGHEDEALWHWHVATQLFPQVSDYQLKAYGDAGAFLTAHPLPAEIELRGEEVDAKSPGKQVAPPRKKVAPHPRIPPAKRGSGRVSVIVQAVIGEDGQFREPRIMQAQGELTLVCTTLDALRRWRFEPAEEDGEPVAAYYVVTLNFTL